jgi:hypothetical protein
MLKEYFIQMKKLLSWSLMLLLIGSLFSTPATGALKAGTACKKVGATSISFGKTFTCIKSGKKMVWDKGKTRSTESQNSKTDKVANPVADTKPVEIDFIPWSIPSNRNQEFKAFKKKVDQWFTDSPHNANSVDVLIDPSLNVSGTHWIQDALIFQGSYMGLSSPNSYKIFIGKSDQWVINQRKKIMPGLESWLPNFACYESANQACASPESREAFFVWSNSKLMSPKDDWQFTRSLSHEFFHITQCDLFGKVELCGEKFNSIPSWFSEGGANVIGAIFMDYLGFLNYENQRSWALGIHSGGKNGANSPLSDFKNNIRFGELFPYEIGMIACEYLIASAGLQAFLDIHSKMGQNLSFEDAFNRSVGITLSDFYKAFDDARVNLDFYPVTKK